MPADAPKLIPRLLSALRKIDHQWPMSQRKQQELTNRVNELHERILHLEKFQQEQKAPTISGENRDD